MQGNPLIKPGGVVQTSGASAKGNASLPFAQGMVPLPWLLKYSLRPPRSFGAVMDAMTSRDLPYAWLEDSKHNGLAAVRICSNKFQEWQQPADGTLSIPEAASFLSTKQEIAYALVRAGLLRGCKLGRGQRIFVEELAQFRATYVFASDIARQLGSSPKAVAERLAAAGIEPLKLEQMRSRRQAIYERQKISDSPLAAML